MASKCPSLSQADPVLENIAQIQVQNLASSIGLPFWKCSFSNWVCPVSDICQYLLSLTPQGNIFFENLMSNVCCNDLQIAHTQTERLVSNPSPFNSGYAGSKIKRLSRGSERLGGMRSGLSAVPPEHCFDSSPSIGAAAARGGAHLAKKSFQTSKREQSRWNRPAVLNPSERKLVGRPALRKQATWVGGGVTTASATMI